MRVGEVAPRSGRPRRGPGGQRPGHQQSVRLPNGRQQGDHHRAGHLVRCRHPGNRRRRQAAAVGRRLRADHRNGARALPHAGHPHAGHRYGAGHHGSRRCAGRCSAGHLHAGHRYGAGHHGSRRCAARCSAGHLHAGHRYGAGHHGSRRCAGRCSAGYPRGGHRRGGRRYEAGHRGNRPCAGRSRGDCPHADHRCADHRSGRHSPAVRRRGHGHERGGCRGRRQRGRAALPGRPGRCRCEMNPACSPVSHPTVCPDPGGCHSGCFHPHCHSGHCRGPGPAKCLNPGAAGRARRHPARWPASRWTRRASGQRCQCPCFHCRCFRCCRRIGPRQHRWRVPDLCSRCGPGRRHRWNGPGRGGHLPNGSGPARRLRYGPGRPDPARLPRSCSTLSRWPLMTLHRRLRPPRAVLASPEP
jgi:hypothetical protein